jgi:hypothetical protein
MLAGVVILLAGAAPASAVATWTGTSCSSSGISDSSGPYSWRYCSNRRSVSGVSYEVQRDTYILSNGRITLWFKNLLDCQNTQDAMPANVRQAYCP